MDNSCHHDATSVKCSGCDAAICSNCYQFYGELVYCPTCWPFKDVEAKGIRQDQPYILLQCTYMKAPFKPTSCACYEDRANCTRQPGCLLPGQLQTIMDHLGEAVADAAKYFWNSPGMVLSRAGQLFRVRTITPRYENGRCVFFTKDSRCAIHSVAPFGCRYFDVHMSRKAANKRVMWGTHQIIDSYAGYSEQRDSLPEATHYLPRSAQ